jgi:hypothetical protein
MTKLERLAKKGPFVYAQFTPPEQMRARHLMGRVVDDGEILDGMREFHSAGTRCAVIVEWGKMSYFLTEADKLGNVIGLPEVSRMLDIYDMKDTLCIVFVRSKRVFATHVAIEQEAPN